MPESVAGSSLSDSLPTRRLRLFADSTSRVPWEDKYLRIRNSPACPSGNNLQNKRRKLTERREKVVPDCWSKRGHTLCDGAGDEEGVLGVVREEMGAREMKRDGVGVSDGEEVEEGVLEAVREEEGVW